MAAIIYRRYSTDEQEKGSSDTLARQLERCHAMAAAKGWEVTEVLTDKGRSAFKGEHLRPDADLGRFIERVRAGDFDQGTILIADNLSRLSRRPVDEAMNWIFEVTRAGLEIALADTGEVFRANPSIGDFISHAVKAGLSHEDSRRKSDMTRASKARLWKLAESRQGQWTNLAAKIPAWLSRTPGCDGWIVDDERAEIVRQIYQRAADGIGVATITASLNAEGVEPFGAPTGRSRSAEHQWGRSSVRQLLQSPIVEGDFRPASGMFEGRVIHDFYPRIVDADVVARARGDLSSRSTTKSRGGVRVGSNLFTGVTVCGECGRPAYLSTSVQKGRPYPYLRCEAASIEGRCENRSGYAYRAFEETVLNVFLDVALDDRFFEATGDLRGARVRKAEIEKVLSDKRAGRARLLQLFASGDDQIAALIGDAKAEIDRLTDELATVEREIATAAGRVSNVEHLRRVEDIRAAAKSEDEEVRLQARSKLRMAMTSIIERIEIERDDAGERVFTVILRGAIMAVRIDTKGRVLRAISDVAGRPLYEGLPADQREALAPIIARIEKLAA